MNTPLVSILMLTYNRAHFLPEAIKSVLEQEYKNFELIILDDGSTDDTEAVVRRFSDTRIRYIHHQDNTGLFARRAESLSHTTGKYIAILDSDDFWTSKNKLSEQVAFLETNSDYVVVGTDAHIVTENSNPIGRVSYAANDVEIRKIILARNQFVHSSILMRTEALKKTTGYQPTLAEDLELILQLGILGKLANIPKPYTAHRVHNNSQNDHGIKMAKAVDAIIKKHTADYPNPLSARIFSKLRIMRGYLKQIF